VAAGDRVLSAADWGGKPVGRCYTTALLWGVGSYACIMSLDAPASRAEFREALEVLIQDAAHNHVAIGGGHEIHLPDDAMSDWEIILTELS
jgi:hypothetical protein